MGLVVGIALLMLGKVDPVLSDLAFLAALALTALLFICLALIKLMPARQASPPLSDPDIDEPEDRFAALHADTEPEPLQAAPVPAADAAAQASVRLVPAIPPDRSGGEGSWIGGVPCLPEQAEWPMLNGEPARFLAQVDCGALPETLWRGLGPRAGALVFFRFARTREGVWPVRVFHVDGVLKPLRAPGESGQRPRWPLRVTSGQDRDAPEPGPTPDWAKLHRLTIRDQAWQPFDWTSALILLSRAGDLVKTTAKLVAADGTPRERALFKEAASDLADLTESLCAIRAKAAFSAELRSALIDGLSILSLPALDGTGACLPLTGHAEFADAYFAAFERYCLRVYAGDPGRLPKAQHDLFEPLWADHARHEGGVMGALAGDVREGAEAGDELLLLELQSSELLGWTFGDARALRIFVAPEALAAGDLTRAWARVIE
ncbi:DUF1963 domain-containing protein [Sedimentitalea sp. JM2-8]|uniref:DUF1963 domain-containing protein n=1 Tax=Sedimentitalea xiamensis TaxID=3050037 RepID=A0ABT7FKY5_9RHOB|nr:DUF1963 domain-containing protein [Sedimentitalea xiamensis]